MKRALPEGVGAGALVGAAIVALRLAEGLLTGRWGLAPGALAEVAGWLPWQLQDNVRHARMPWDATVFTDGTASLWSLTGNPGGAVLAAPIYTLVGAAAAPVVVTLLGLFTNAVAGGMFGARHRIPVVGALAASASWWALGFTEGTAAQVWLAPGLLAAACAGRSRRASALFALLGALVAPLPTAVVLLAAGELPLAATALLGLLVAPLGTWGGTGWVGADLAWYSGGARRAMPLAAAFALAALLRGPGRWLGALVLVVLALGFSPSTLAGFRLQVPAAASSAPTAAVLAFLLVAGVRLAGDRLRADARAALVLLLSFDAAGPLLVAGGSLWHEARPLPEALRSLAGTPRVTTIHVAPASRSPAAGVGLLPHHQQRMARAPTVDQEVGSAPELGPERVLFSLRRENPRMVLLLTTDDAVERSAWATKLGPPREVRPDMAVWAWP